MSGPAFANYVRMAKLGIPMRYHREGAACAKLESNIDASGFMWLLYPL